ncbi:hypothetical protein BHE74_00015259 [Ensete ventricosum]|nr:hypothetical protein GW17_00029487 [Ensete ventricosum]RWW76639.1 hypothetical protein BHE74_00015259 [Ensete ventricosum]RZS25859.1 hypothetical protein BHM03_00059126 [Ensete ventricosum]
MAFPSSEIPHRRWSTPMGRHLSLPTVAKIDDCFASETGKELRPRRKPASGAAAAEAAAAALRGPEPCEGGGEEEGFTRCRRGVGGGICRGASFVPEKEP